MNQNKVDILYISFSYPFSDISLVMW